MRFFCSSSKTDLLLKEKKQKIELALKQVEQELYQEAENVYNLKEHIKSHILRLRQENPLSAFDQKVKEQITNTVKIINQTKLKILNENIIKLKEKKRLLQFKLKSIIYKLNKRTIYANKKEIGYHMYKKVIRQKNKEIKSLEKLEKLAIIDELLKKKK